MSVPSSENTGVTACNLVGAVTQTLTCGIFTVIFLTASYVFLKRGFNRRSNFVIFMGMIPAFALSFAQWASAMAALILGIAGLLPYTEPYATVNAIHVNLTAIQSINLLFADAVVVWRMWVLCGATPARKVLSIPLTLLWATSLTIMATIGLRVYISSLPENEQVRSKRLESILNIPQVASVVFSLGTNITATLVIAWRAWVYRQDMRGIIRTGSDLPRLEGILVLFVESGLLFCVSSTFRFLGMFVRFSFDCTLGDIYGPTHSQIAGMYPALVMVMLSSRTERSRSLQPRLESIVSGIIGVIVTM